jgi:hypothetical protein
MLAALDAAPHLGAAWNREGEIKAQHPHAK